VPSSSLPDYTFFAAARFAAHIFLVAAMIAALPAALSLRLGFGVAAGAGAVVAFAAFAALAFFRFATSAAFVAADSFRFAFGAATRTGAGDGGSDSPRILAHLAFCATAIFLRAAAENFLRVLGVASGAATLDSTESPDNIARSSAI
jgi:hypothetical protein